MLAKEIKLLCTVKTAVAQTALLCVLFKNGTCSELTHQHTSSLILLELLHSLVSSDTSMFCVSWFPVALSKGRSRPTELWNTPKSQAPPRRPRRCHRGPPRGRFGSNTVVAEAPLTSLNTPPAPGKALLCSFSSQTSRSDSYPGRRKFSSARRAGPRGSDRRWGTVPSAGGKSSHRL